MLSLSSIENNSQQLGAYTRTGFGFHKSYLARSASGQWGILKLNPYQVFLRNCLGLYKQTRLPQVLNEWKRYQFENGQKFPLLTERLEALWAKTYPKRELPYHSYFGNADVAKAQVINLGLLYTDPFDLPSAAKFISKHYTQGDIVLIEGVDIDQKVVVDKNQLTKLIDKPVIVQGWEPIGYTEAHAKVFEASLNFDSACAHYIFEFGVLFENPRFQDGTRLSFCDPSSNERKKIDLDAKGLEKLWERIFKNQILGFQKLMKQIGEASKEPDVFLPYSERLMASFDLYVRSQDLSVLKREINEITTTVQQILEKKKYRNLFNENASRFFADTWPIRQASLAQQIDRCCSAGKRVFVMAGAAHFFPNRGKTASQVVDTLKKYKFTIALGNSESNKQYYSFKELRAKIAAKP